MQRHALAHALSWCSLSGDADGFGGVVGDGGDDAGNGAGVGDDDDGEGLRKGLQKAGKMPLADPKPNQLFFEDNSSSLQYTGEFIKKRVVKYNDPLF